MKKKFLSAFIASFLAFGYYAQQFGPIVIVPGAEGSRPRDFKKLNNLLIFTASDSSTYWPRKIFRSDGTYAGTYELNSNISVSSNDSTFVKLYNYLYFCGTQNSISSLWRTDGSVNGTTMVYGGGCGRMVVLNQNLYFLTSITDPIWGTTTTKLMKHEPLSNLTTEVYNWNNSNLLNGTSPLRVYNNKIYFYGWQSDGTTANTIQNNVNLPSLSESCVYNGLIYYRGNNGKLWRTDGTISGTFQAVDFPLWFNGITVYNNLMYFAGGNVGAGMQGTEFCSSDGTLANTNVVKDIYFGYNSSQPSDFSIVNGSLYFLADDGIHGNEIYKSDGTSNGTFLLKDIELGVTSSFYSNYYSYEQYNSKIQHLNQLYFNLIPYFGTSNGIWKSDGTTSNTTQVFQIDTTRSLMDVNGKLFFAGYTPNEGWELYAEGLTADINEGSIYSSVKIFPNPTNDYITIQSEEILHKRIEIVDQFGRMILESTIESSDAKIDLKSLLPGIYFLHLEGEPETFKIIKN